MDNSYRGEIMVILHNSSPEFRRVTKGQKVAQLVVAPYVQAEFSTEDVLTETERGAGGLGSTGLEAKPVPFPPVSAPLYGGRPVTTYVYSPEDGKRLEHRGDD